MKKRKVLEVEIKDNTVYTAKKEMKKVDKRLEEIKLNIDEEKMAKNCMAYCLNPLQVWALAKDYYRKKDRKMKSLRRGDTI